MISVIIPFRFQQQALAAAGRIHQALAYWEVVSDLFGLELVFINDHSDISLPAKTYIHDMPGNKVDWNQPAARNYGADLAQGDKLLFTDIDHFICSDFNRLDREPLVNTFVRFLRFKKVDGNYTPIEPHTNTFLINRSGFIRYDESFCGNYGSDDTDFFFRLRKTHRRGIVPSTLGYAYVNDLPGVKLPKDMTVNRKKFFEKRALEGNLSGSEEGSP